MRPPRTDSARECVIKLDPDGFGSGREAVGQNRQGSEHTQNDSQKNGQADNCASHTLPFPQLRPRDTNRITLHRECSRKPNSDCGDFQTLYTIPMLMTEHLQQSLVLIGPMGVGKTTIGRRLATALRCVFRDSDEAIETAAGRSVSDIFNDFGEAAFRDGERKIIARLLSEPPMVLALGGGAFMSAETRALIRQHATSIWLDADLDTLMKRVGRRDTRPLLQTDDPRAVMASLLAKRNPVYAEADIHIDAAGSSHEETVRTILAQLERSHDR